MAPRYWIVLAAGTLVIFAGVMFFLSSEPEPSERAVALPSPPAATIPAPEPVSSVPEPEPVPVEPEPDAAPAIELPSLNDSDEFVREQVEVLSRDGSLGWLLATDELLRKFTVMLENAASGEVPRDPVAFLAPREAFSVVVRDGRTYVNPASYERFDRVASVFAEVDANQALAFVRLVEPLLASAYAEIGLRDVDVEVRLRDAVDLLLATPAVPLSVELRQPSVMYQYADSSLEALAPTQKLLLRMGPENGAMVRAKLVEMRALLGEG